MPALATNESTGKPKKYELTGCARPSHDKNFSAWLGSYRLSFRVASSESLIEGKVRVELRRMDSSFAFVLLLALLPGAGNFAGGLVAEFWKPTPQLLNWALHAAAGIVIAVVAVELVPEALRSLAGWWLALAFTAGGIAYTLIERGLQWLQSGSGGGRTRMWMIYVAVAVDLTSDGLLIGTGSAVSTTLALILAAGQVLADVPEGYAAVANFRDKKMPRGRRLIASGSFVAFPLLAAALAYALLRGVPESLQMAALMFVAGLLTIAAVEEMLQEAHAERADNQRSALAFIGGFALFALISAGLETVVGNRAQGSQPQTGRESAAVNKHTVSPTGSHSGSQSERSPHDVA